MFPLPLSTSCIEVGPDKVTGGRTDALPGVGLVYGSVCSGIEAATAAWHPLGWRASFFSEIEAFPRAVLAHHYPDVPLHGDFTTIESGHYEPIGLLVGGTPCQSFSVAGLRGGLADDRGNLALEFLRLAQRLGPRWLVWENVPGVLSSGGGRDFGSILGGMGELGYGVAYRVLDAQHFGVPQRRRRVFVVGYLGDWRRAAAVLFERHSLSGDTPPRRQTGERVAPTISARTKGGGGLGTDFDCDGGLIAKCLNAHGGIGRIDAESETFIAHPLRAQSQPSHRADSDTYVPTYTLAIRGRGDSHDLEYRTDGTANAILTPNGGRAGIGVGAVAFGWQASPSQTMNPDVVTPALDKSKTVAIAFDAVQITSKANRSRAEAGLPASTLSSRSRMHAASEMAVRRLTPRECERLQGFPDDFTLVPYRGKPAADGPRYKALGNSMAVPCMAWIGRRIQMVESLFQSPAVALPGNATGLSAIVSLPGAEGGFIADQEVNVRACRHDENMTEARSIGYVPEEHTHDRSPR